MEKNEKILRRVAASGGVHVRESGEGEAPSRIIEGYAIVFNERSVPLYEDDEMRLYEVIDPEAVTREFLDVQDIKFTMYHDRQILLARSCKGQGSLKYEVDERGVKFSFSAPETMHGDEALELVRRGDITGCSFAFSTMYRDSKHVERTVKSVDGFDEVTCRVKRMTGIYDMTLAQDPAYPQTETACRELAESLRPARAEDESSACKAQVASMRRHSLKNWKQS